MDFANRQQNIQNRVLSPFSSLLSSVLSPLLSPLLLLGPLSYVLCPLPSLLPFDYDYVGLHWIVCAITMHSFYPGIASTFFILLLLKCSVFRKDTVTSDSCIWKKMKSKSTTMNNSLPQPRVWFFTMTLTPWVMTYPPTVCNAWPVDVNMLP